MNTNKVLKLHIPYFEFLRLASWNKLMYPYSLAGMGDISLHNGIATVNRFRLFKQEKKSSIDVVKNLGWDMATEKAMGEIALWFFSESTLLLPHCASYVLDTFAKNKPPGIKYAIALLVGDKGQVHSSVTLFEPFFVYKKITTELILPIADKSAVDNWLGELKKYVTDFDAEGNVKTICLPITSYAAHFQNEDVFFDLSQKQLALESVQSTTQHKGDKSEHREE